MAPRKVLIPLDGSAFSRHVIPHVCEVLDVGSYAVTLLRVAAPPEGVTSPPPRPLMLDGWLMDRERLDRGHPIYQSQVWDALEEQLRQELGPELRRLTDAGFDVTAQVRFGDPAQEIIDVVQNEGYALVVMATHGRSGLGRLILGSVAEAVLRSVSVPVMMVRPQPTLAGEALPLDANPAI